MGDYGGLWCSEETDAVEALERGLVSVRRGYDGGGGSLTFAGHAGRSAFTGLEPCRLRLGNFAQNDTTRKYEYAQTTG